MEQWWAMTPTAGDAVGAGRYGSGDRRGGWGGIAKLRLARASGGGGDEEIRWRERRS